MCRLYGRGCCCLTFLVGKRSITNARAWRIDGTWERINHKLHQWLFVTRRPRSLPQCRDSRFLQSVKTATPAAIEVGYDTAKLVLGRKRYLLVDTFGLVLMVVVTAASVPERAGAKLVFARLERVRYCVNRLVLIWVDGGYQGQDFMRFVMDTHHLIVQAVLRKDLVKGFVPIAQRWKVERTFGWFNWCR